MGYIISNPDKSLYIRIGDKGKTETCVRGDAQTFTHAKACNVLNNIPRTLQKFNFVVMEDDRKEFEKNIQADKNILTSEDYEISPAVSKWIDKVKVCDDLMREAQQRKEELKQELSRTDRELSNILHTIEIENWKNGCEGYKCYRESKVVLEKRRPIKDELAIIQAILETSTATITERKIIQMVNGLKDRKFSYRDVNTNSWEEE